MDLADLVRCAEVHAVKAPVDLNALFGLAPANTIPILEGSGQIDDLIRDKVERFVKEAFVRQVVETVLPGQTIVKPGPQPRPAADEAEAVLDKIHTKATDSNLSRKDRKKS